MKAINDTSNLMIIERRGSYYTSVTMDSDFMNFIGECQQNCHVHVLDFILMSFYVALLLTEISS